MYEKQFVAVIWRQCHVQNAYGDGKNIDDQDIWNKKQKCLNRSEDQISEIELYRSNIVEYYQGQF